MTRDPRFSGRVNRIVSGGVVDVSIPVDDTEVICNSCNRNVHDTEDENSFGWLVYLSKNDLKKDRPYDFYCDGCKKEGGPLFRHAVEV